VFQALYVHEVGPQVQDMLFLQGQSFYSTLFLALAVNAAVDDSVGSFPYFFHDFVFLLEQGLRLGCQVLFGLI
jgi:hypothetical protein